MSALRPVVLSGGAGTRLWPLSTASHPKQFVRLLPGDTLFNRSLSRFAGEDGFLAPFVVTSTRHLPLVVDAVAETGVEPEVIIAEPIGRNTAPAALAAALLADTGDLLLILPSDHLIEDKGSFVRSVMAGATLAREGHLVTFGITPTRVDAGFGYIERGDPVGEAYRVAQFVEKPDPVEAEAMIEAGFLWNSGMFVMTAGALLEEARFHCPSILAGVEKAMTAADGGIVQLAESFGLVEAASIDMAIMEKTERAVVMPVDVGWSDIGSYDALWSVLDRDDSGNSTSGPVALVDVHGSLVRATTRTVAVAGLDDVIVVETEEAVIVARRDQSQIIREVVAKLEAGRDQAE